MLGVRDTDTTQTTAISLSEYRNGAAALDRAKILDPEAGSRYPYCANTRWSLFLNSVNIGLKGCIGEFQRNGRYNAIHGAVRLPLLNKWRC